MKLDDAYPRTPDSFRDMMVNTLDSLPQESKMHHAKPRRMLLIAAIVALMLCGIALAAGRMGLLDMLFYGKTPSSAAVETVETVDTESAQSGYSVGVEQYLIDGERLYMSLTLSVPDSGYTIAFTDISVSSGDCIVSGVPDTSCMTTLGGDFGTQKQLSAQLIFDKMPKGTFDVTINVYFMQPKLPVRMCSYYDATADGVFPASDNDILYVDEESGNFIPDMREDYSNQIQGVNYDFGAQSTAALLTRMGITYQPICVSVKFSVNPNASAGTLFSLDEPIEKAFSEYTFVMTRADFTAASALLEFEVHPTRDIAEMTMTNDDPLYRGYEVRLSNGTRLDEMSGGGYSTERDSNGKVYLDYEMHLSAMNVVPDEIILVPYRESEDGTRTYFESEAVTIPMSKEAGNQKG